MPRARSKAAYMISAVAVRYEVHPQTLRLYEREGLLKPSRSEGNTRLYTDEDLDRLEVILQLTRELGVNLAGEFVESLNREMTLRVRQQEHRPETSLIPVVRLTPVVPQKPPRRKR
jgi:MerR family transcriptional regulator/heat shock protein HspR